MKSNKAVSVWLVAVFNVTQSLLAQTNTFPSSGSVGIGTASPAANLEIYGSGPTMKLTQNPSIAGDVVLTLAAAGTSNTTTLNLGGAMLQNNTNGSNALILNPSSGSVGIGTSSPAFPLDVVGDVRSMGNLIEKRVVFTPTAVGWYRIVSGAGQAGGTIRTSGSYDGATTAVELTFNIRGWSQGGALTLLKNSGVNGGLIDQARISTDGGGSMYLDLHIASATAPSAITIYGYGPGMPTFVASPIVGATAGSTNVQVLPLYAYDGLSTTGNVVTYSDDGTTPQGYIYHGRLNQAAFGNGIVNGETWITRTGGAGSIKFGEYDLGTAYLTIAGSSGYVGIGTTNPTYPLSVNGTIEAKEVIVQTGWSDYVFDDGYRLAPLSEVEQHIKTDKHLPGIPSAKDVAEHGVDMGDMQAKLLAKIEELTLHVIAQEKQLQQQTRWLEEQERNVEALSVDNRLLHAQLKALLKP